VRRCLLSVALLLGLVVTMAGCVPAPTPKPVPTSTAAPTERVLDRWARWMLSGLTQTGYPEFPHRPYCAADPGSSLWFLNGPSPNEPTRRWTCTLPARRGLVVVPVSVSLPVGAMDCATALSVFTGTAEIDGRPLLLRPAGPVDIRSPLPSSTPPLGTCVLWTVTPELERGPHTLTMTLTGSGFDRVEVSVDLTAT
jgi:hypothetical protein